MNTVAIQQARQLSTLLVQPKYTKADKKDIDRLVNILGDVGENLLAVATVDQHAILRASSMTTVEKWNAIFDGKDVVYRNDFSS